MQCGVPSQRVSVCCHKHLFSAYSRSAFRGVQTCSSREQCAINSQKQREIMIILEPAEILMMYKNNRAALIKPVRVDFDLKMSFTCLIFLFVLIYFLGVGVCKCGCVCNVDSLGDLT